MLTTDQLNHRVAISEFPRRIISLVPSQTELLFDLGLENEIVGITKFCIHPAEKVKGKTIIGGTKNFRFEMIDALKPDLIIGNKEENYEEGINRLKEKYPVWMSDIVSLEDALEMIEKVGEVIGKPAEAEGLITAIRSNFKKLKPKLRRKALYLIWKNPYMAAASGTFIDTMLNTIGWENAVADDERYPELSPETIRSLNPELILLSSEPYPFKEKHMAEFRELCPHAEVKIVDGEMFSWYGSRLQYATDYFSVL